MKRWRECTPGTGGKIRILPASGALGTGLYRWNRGEWALTKDYAGCCRTTGTDARAWAERETFLAEEWVAANSRTGAPIEPAYQIAMRATPCVWPLFSCGRRIRL